MSSRITSVRCSRWLLPLLWFFGGVAAWAAVPAESAPAAQAPAEAAVVVANRSVAVFRVPFFGVAPQQRANRAEATLGELLGRGGVAAVTVQVAGQGHVLLVDGEWAFVLVQGDADALQGQSLAQASSAAQQALQRVIAETREGRDSRRLLNSLLLGLGATVLALGAIALVTWLRRRAGARAAAFLARRAAAVRVAGTEILQGERLVALVGALLRVMAWLVVAGVLYNWLSFVLRLFPYTRPWGEQLTAFLVGAAGRIGQGVLGALPDLFIAASIFVIARAVIAAIRPFFGRIAAGRFQGGWLDADTVGPTQRLFGVAVWLFAVVMAYPYLPGADSEAFKGMSVLVGLMLTVGGSSLVGQAASGLVLMYSRTLRVGEYVRINEHEGTVTEMGAFTTRIRTGLGEELTLPNALVLGTVTKNYSRAVKGQGFVVDTVVTIGYDTPWRQVEALLLEAARRTPGMLEDPPPRVFQTALSDFYPEYRLVCQASAQLPRPRAEALSRLHANIQDVFNAHGVQIMSPHYLGDPAAAKVVPEAAWYTAPARKPDDEADNLAAHRVVP